MQLRSAQLDPVLQEINWWGNGLIDLTLTAGMRWLFVTHPRGEISHVYAANPPASVEPLRVLVYFSMLIISPKLCSNRWTVFCSIACRCKASWVFVIAIRESPAGARVPDVQWRAGWLNGLGSRLTLPQTDERVKQLEVRNPCLFDLLQRSLIRSHQSFCWPESL